MITSEDIKNWNSHEDTCNCTSFGCGDSHNTYCIDPEVGSYEETQQIIADIARVFELYEAHQHDVEKMKEEGNGHLIVTLDEERKKSNDMAIMIKDLKIDQSNKKYEIETLKEDKRKLTQNVQSLRDGKKDVIKNYLEKELKQIS